MSTTKRRGKSIFETIRGPLRFPGGKTRTVPKIMSVLPEFNEYREPMLGGGSVFLSVRNAFPLRKYWINDLNHSLYSFWQICKNNPSLLVSEAAALKKSGKRGKEIFLDLKYPQMALNDFETALRYFVLNRISFSGLAESGGYSEESFVKRFNQYSFDRVIFVSEYLKGVRISNMDYAPLLSEPGEGVFIYVDPPYFNNKNSRLYGKDGELHVIFNHERLRDSLKKSPHTWLLTYDENRSIKEMYSFANIYRRQISYGMNNVALDGKARRGNELFITNYDIRRKTLLDYTLKETS